MSIRVEVYDGNIPLIDEMLKISVTVALQGLSQAGSKIQKYSRKNFEMYRHGWLQEFAGGKRTIRKSGENAKQLGLRLVHNSGEDADPASMKNFIMSYLMPKHLMVIVGGAHPGFTPVKYENGAVAGTLPYQNGVSKQGQAIIHKLNTGERNEHHRWDGSAKSMARFEGATYIGRGFMDKGFNSARAEVAQAMTTLAEANFHRAVGNVEVKIRRVV